MSRKRKILDFTTNDLMLKNELDLFSSRPHQSSILSSTWVDIQPIGGALKETGTISFHIPANEEQYLDPVFYLKSTLFIDFPALETNKNDDGLDVAPVNLFGHAMFKRIDIKLQDTIITTAADNYPYRAYIERLLNYGSDAKTTQLNAELFYPDVPGKVNELNKNHNYGYGARREIVLLRKKFVLFVRLSTDIGNQPRLLPNGVSVDVLLHQSSNAFRLMHSSETSPPKIHIEEAVLFVRRVQLTPPMATFLASMLRNHPAKYPITRAVVKEFQITSGRTQINRESISRGLLPRSVIVGLVESDSFNGTSTKSPFNFVSKSPSFICLYNENEIIPSIPYTPKWSENDAIREYLSIFKASGMYGRNAGNQITYDDYLKGGYVLYGFDITPDESPTHSHGLAPRQGELSLKMIFDATNIDQSCTIVVYMIYDNCIYIDHHRNIVTDFAA